MYISVSSQWHWHSYLYSVRSNLNRAKRLFEYIRHNEINVIRWQSKISRGRRRENDKHWFWSSLSLSFSFKWQNVTFGLHPPQHPGQLHHLDWVKHEMRSKHSRRQEHTCCDEQLVVPASVFIIATQHQLKSSSSSQRCRAQPPSRSAVSGARLKRRLSFNCAPMSLPLHNTRVEGKCGSAAVVVLH